MFCSFCILMLLIYAELSPPKKSEARTTGGDQTNYTYVPAVIPANDDNNTDDTYNEPSYEYNPDDYYRNDRSGADQLGY